MKVIYRPHFPAAYLLGQKASAGDLTSSSDLTKRAYEEPPHHSRSTDGSARRAPLGCIGSAHQGEDRPMVKGDQFPTGVSPMLGPPLRDLCRLFGLPSGPKITFLKLSILDDHLLCILKLCT